MPFENISGPSQRLEIPAAPTIASVNYPRQIFPTAELVQQSVNSINQVLQQMSPLAKMQRQVQMLQLQAQQRLFQDYMQNPNAYQFGPGGIPIPRDRYKYLLEAALLKTRVQNIQKGADAAAARATGTNFIDAVNNLTGGQKPAPQGQQQQAPQQSDQIQLPPQTEASPTVPDEPPLQTDPTGQQLS